MRTSMQAFAKLIILKIFLIWKYEKFDLLVIWGFKKTMQLPEANMWSNYFEQHFLLFQVSTTKQASIRFDWPRFELSPVAARTHQVTTTGTGVPSGPTVASSMMFDDVSMETRQEKQHLEMRTKLLEAKFHEEKLLIQQRHDEAIQKVARLSRHLKSLILNVNILHSVKASLCVPWHAMTRPFPLVLFVFPHCQT